MSAAVSRSGECNRCVRPIDCGVVPVPRTPRSGHPLCRLPAFELFSRALAQSHGGAANPETRGQIELLFSAINSYGGGIGELLGVSIFMALSLGLLCAYALRTGALPRWLAALGLVTSLALASVATPSFGLALALPIAVGVTLLSVWMLAAGVWLLRSR